MHWPDVVLAAVGSAQVVLLAWLAGRTHNAARRVDELNGKTRELVALIREIVREGNSR